jgi:hypothetical protein
MVSNHPLVSRKYFTERYRAEEKFLAAQEDSIAAGAALDELKEVTIPAKKAAIAAKHEAYEKAIGNYRLASQKERDLAKDSATVWVNLDAALKDWNPDFDLDGATNADAWKSGQNKKTPTFNVDSKGQKIDGSQIDTTTGHESGMAQYKLLYARKVKAEAAERLYMLEQLLLRNPEGTDAYQNLHEEYEDAQKDGGFWADAVAAEAKAYALAFGDPTNNIKGAKKTYEDALLAYNKVMGEDLLAALDTTIYNFNIPDNYFHKIVTYPTTASDDRYNVNDDYYDSETDTWSIKVPKNRYSNKKVTRVLGSAQVDLVEAVNEVEDAIHDSKYSFDRDGKPNAYKAWKQAKQAYDEALSDFNEKDAALVTELAKEGIIIADKYVDGKAEELYQAYRVEKKKYFAAGDEWATLEKFYNSWYPDEVFAELGYTEVKHSRLSPRDDVSSYDSETANLSWLVSNYNVNYNATKLNQAGKEVYIASVLYPTGVLSIKKNAVSATPDKVSSSSELVKEEGVEPTVDMIKNSLQFQIEFDTNLYKVVIPEMTAGSKTWWENEKKEYKARLDGIMDKVNAFEAYESSYKDWIKERQDAEKKVNEAEIARFKAEQAEIEAKANYDAAKAAADGKVYLWNENKTKWQQNGRNWERVPDPGFVEVSIPDAIKMIEAENEEIEARKYQLQLDLKYGKLTYQTVMQVLDETIQTLSADIEIWTAIANKYKAIMNAYLGIVDETVAEEPADEE